MKHLGFFALIVVISVKGYAQEKYFQQELTYTINAELNEQERSITGFETLVYKNNAPSALEFIWFHIYPNAYKNESTSLFQQIKNDDSRKQKLNKVTHGRIEKLDFKVNGLDAKVEAHSNPAYIDVVKLMLHTPLKPGDSVTITTPFKVFFPSYFSRSGFADGEFIATQWYPKPAVFDNKGWHEMPYLDMGEFYSEYGKYTVNLTVPSAFVVGATGILQNVDELSTYKTIGNSNLGKTKKFNGYSYKGSSATKTIQFIAENVPDFAWFGDKAFVIQYDTIVLPSGKTIDAFSYFYDKKNTVWANSIEYIKEATRKYSEWIGEYDYPTVQAVEGPKNNTSGGMEYPMITLITSPDSKSETLDAIITHEVGHNWFMSFLGSNEREYPWLDEGLNSYFQFRYEAEKYRNNSVFGDKIPAGLKSLPPDEFLSIIYKALLQIPMEQPIQTPAYDFVKSDDYGITVYVKPAMWMYIVELSIGREKLDNAIKYYFKKWKFKHPKPEDMKIAFEEATGIGMDKIFELLKKKGPLN
jgi:hypothetical protein